MKEVYEGIVSFLKNYQERTHVKGYVLGKGFYWNCSTQETC